MIPPAAATRSLHHPDTAVQEVLDIWTARLVAGQIPFGDITTTLARIGDWTGWGAEWMETAASHERLGEEAWAEGRRLSAVASFLTAARCYHVAYFLTVHDAGLHERGLAKMVECHDRTLGHQEPPVEKIEIRFEDGPLLALLSLPRGEGPFPLVLLLPGLDSTKETRHGGRVPLLRRGMAVLSLDGPGQGEVSRQLPLRYDYEVGHARRIAAEAADATLIEVQHGAHGVSNLSYAFAPWVNDWMARQLQGRVE